MSVSLKIRTQFLAWLNFMFILHQINWCYKFRNGTVGGTRSTLAIEWLRSYSIFVVLTMRRLHKLHLRNSLRALVGFDLITVHALSSKEICAEPGFKPGAAGWEARMLPLCYATPQRSYSIKTSDFTVGGMLYPGYSSVLTNLRSRDSMILCQSHLNNLFYSFRYCIEVPWVPRLPLSLD